MNDKNEKLTAVQEIVESGVNVSKELVFKKPIEDMTLEEMFAAWCVIDFMEKEGLNERKKSLRDELLKNVNETVLTVNAKGHKELPLLGGMVTRQCRKEKVSFDETILQDILVKKRFRRLTAVKTISYDASKIMNLIEKLETILVYHTDLWAEVADIQRELEAPKSVEYDEGAILQLFALNILTIDDMQAIKVEGKEAFALVITKPKQLVNLLKEAF